MYSAVIDHIVSNWPKDKQDEVATVMKFLNNSGSSFALTPANIEAHPDEPADVWVRDINQTFQIVIGDFEQYEMLGRAKAVNGIKLVSMRRTSADYIREYITKPLQK